MIIHWIGVLDELQNKFSYEEFICRCKHDKIEGCCALTFAHVTGIYHVAKERYKDSISVIAYDKFINEKTVDIKVSKETKCCSSPTDHFAHTLPKALVDISERSN